MNSTVNTKRVTLKILNQNGDTELVLDSDRAVTTIMDKCVHEGRFAYVNYEPFTLSLAAVKEDKKAFEQESDRLRNLLNTSENPTVQLTDALQGGV